VIPIGVAGLAAFATAAFVASRAQPGPRARTLVAVCLAIGGWLVCLFIAFGWSDPRLARISVFFSTFCSVLLPHFALAMDPRGNQPGGRRWLWAHYAAAGVLAALALGTRWIWDEMGFRDGHYHETYGPGIAAFVPFTLGGFGLAIYRLVTAARRASGLDRLRLHWVLLGIGGTVLGCVTTNLVLPVLGFQDAMVLGPVSTLVLFACTAVAVIRFELMGIRTVFHVTASWAAVSTLAMLPLAAALAAARPWLEGLGTPAYAASLFAAFVAFQQLAARVQPRVDRWFGKDRHARADAVRQLVETLGHLATPAAIAEKVLHAVALFRPVNAAVWVAVPGGQGLALVAATGRGLPPARLVAGTIDLPAPGIYECTSGQALGELLPPGHGFALAAPLIVAGRLVGLLGVGPRAAPYDALDQAQLRAVGAAAAVALSNALAYEQAIRDPLTGLYNRAFLSEVLRQEVALCAREGKPFGLLLVDLDDFKAINDTHGHAAGDAALVAVARQLEASVRASDVVVRLGGDEFVVLLRGIADRPAVDAVATTVETAIRGTPASERGPLGSLGASIGRATFPGDGNSGDTLLRAADADLYARKRSHAAAG